MKRLVIFDLDGTLLNTIEDLGTAVNYALARRDLPQHDMEAYKTMVGHGVRNLVTKALPFGREDLVDECLADFKAYYMDHIDVKTKPYPGMRDLLQKLHGDGWLMAVASNKFQAGTEKLIANIFPEIPFIAVLGNREGKPLKPDPALIAEIKQIAWEACGRKEKVGHTLLVGDSDTDIKTAANAGIPAIAVTWGFRTVGELREAGAYNLADTAEQVYGYIYNYI